MFNRGRGVYQYRNLTNGKMYIGSTNSFKRRKKEHSGDLRRNQHDNAHFQSAYNKYGVDNFEFEILERGFSGSDYELLELEQSHIDMYDFKKDLYNIIPNVLGGLGAGAGGRSVVQMTAQHSIIKTFDSMPLAERETGADSKAILKTCKGQRFTAGGFVWKYQDSTDKELRKWNKKQASERLAKEILQFTKSGELVGRHNSSHEAGRMTGIDRSAITKCCNRKRKSAGGFVWQYSIS